MPMVLESIFSRKIDDELEQTEARCGDFSQGAVIISQVKNIEERKREEVVAETSRRYN